MGCSVGKGAISRQLVGRIFRSGGRLLVFRASPQRHTYGGITAEHRNVIRVKKQINNTRVRAPMQGH